MKELAREERIQQNFVGTKIVSDLIVRKAKLSDCKDIYVWRNDDLAVRMSFSSEPVIWKIHSQWFTNALLSEEKMILICKDETNRHKLGMVRFEFLENGKQSEISINLCPKMRGKGLAKKCLKSSISFMLNEKPNCEILVADIKLLNEASKRSFEGIGFRMDSENNIFWRFKFYC